MKSALSVCAFIITTITISSAQETPTKLQLDTMTIRGSLLRDQNAPNLKLPTLKFDSVVVELYLSGNRLAIVSQEFQSYINKDLIQETEMYTETYGGNKTLLRIQMFVIPEQRKKTR